MTPLRWTAAVVALFLCAVPARAADPVKRDRYKGADELAARVDKILAENWRKAGIEPAREADDAEWARRAYLDLAGRIPSVTEARTFLKDKHEDKRVRLVEKLLSSPRYATNFARIWRSLLLPETNSNIQLRFLAPSFEAWLRQWLVSERGYDSMVKDLLTAPVMGRGNFGFGNGEPAALPFYFAKELKPEELASATSRIFLGVNLGCAQCHNHPFADWKKDQFWSFAAFFSGIESRRLMDIALPAGETQDRHEISIPNTEKKAKAKFLDGKQPLVKKGAKVRATLADWVTAKENPYFARAAVNRTWAHFFGTGLMEPLDEMVGTEHKPAQPQVLDELATAFAKQDYDMRWLIRTIATTKAYNLSSARKHPTQDDPGQFARAALRGLSGEQLFDSLAQATGYAEAGGMGFGFPGQSGRDDFLSKFNTTDRPTEVRTSILQALTMMNGKLIGTATSLEQSETLAAVADAPFMSSKDKVETLYLAALSRKPTAPVLNRLAAFVDKGGTSKADDEERRRKEALSDVFWALLNSAEFYLNH